MEGVGSGDYPIGEFSVCVVVLLPFHSLFLAESSVFAIRDIYRKFVYAVIIIQNSRLCPQFDPSEEGPPFLANILPFAAFLYHCSSCQVVSKEKAFQVKFLVTSPGYVF